MRGLVEKYGILHVKRRPPFIALSRSIIAQQISTKAADSIREKILTQFGTDPHIYSAVSVAQLRDLGLTKAKAQCILEVARNAAAGAFDGFETRTDEHVGAELRRIRGVGPWTAAMFLVFGLG